MRHAINPQDAAVGDEPRADRGFDGLSADEVADRRELEVRDEPVLGDDVALVGLADLDLEFALAERLVQQVCIVRLYQGLLALVYHLLVDRHRSIVSYTARSAT